MHQSLVQYSAVGIGGALGSMARFFVATVCGKYFGTAFPYGTLVVNVTGSLFLGWFLTVALHEKSVVTDAMRAAVAIGFVGGYTTFSTFAFESNTLLAAGAGVKSTINMVGSVVLGLLAVRMGIWLGGR
jgi:CrcB protein